MTTGQRYRPPRGLLAWRVSARLAILGALVAILGGKPAERRRRACQTIGYAAILVILFGIAYLAGGGK